LDEFKRSDDFPAGMEIKMIDLQRTLEGFQLAWSEIDMMELLQAWRETDIMELPWAWREIEIDLEQAPTEIDEMNFDRD
jgi:hypothetical protein